jgi:hypothetical protein
MVGDQICSVGYYKDKSRGTRDRLWHLADIDLDAEHVWLWG